MTKPREPRSSLERELMSIRDIVRAIQRLDNDRQVVRVLGSAIGHVKGVSSANVVVGLLDAPSVKWVTGS